MFNLAQFARNAPCTKPLLAFAALSLMISFIFSTVIVTAGKQESGKGLYIVSFEYDLPDMSNSLSKRQNIPADEEPRTTVRSTNVHVVPSTVTGPPPAATETQTEEEPETSAPASSPMPTPAPSSGVMLQEKFKSAVFNLIQDDNKNATIQFLHARVGYSGICVEVNSMEGIKGSQWMCGSMNTTETLGATAGGDPFDLIGVALYFKDKIAFSLPWWIATVSLGIAMACQMVCMIPLIPVPPVVQKIAAGLSIIGCLALLGGLVLQHVAANTVASLSLKLTMGTVNAHVGRMNQALGWSGFALSFLASIAVGAVVAAEMLLEKGDRMIDRTVDAGITKVEQKLSPKIGFGGYDQNRSVSGSSVGSGLGRTLRDNGPDVLRGLAKAKTRGDALNAVASGFRNEKPPHAYNMV